MTQPTPQRTSFRSASPEQIGDFWETTLGWRLTFDRTERRPAALRLDTAMLGGIATGHHQSGIAYSGTLDVADSYVAWVSTRGRSSYRDRGREYASRPDHVLAYTPGARQLTATIEAGTDSTYLTLESWVLERHLETLLERPVTGPIMLAADTPLQPGRGGSWWSLLQVLSEVLLTEDNSMFHPAVAGPLCEAMLTSLLLSVDHQYTDALVRPVTPCRPRHVRRAIEAIHAHPEHPYTVSSLAELAGVSVRTLQQGFRAHLHTSPMAYLRHVRLARAHDELSRNDTVTIAEVAFRWGFAHLGRFSAAYARQYGNLPSRSGHRAPT